MGMYRTIQDRLDGDGRADEGYVSRYSSGSDQGSGRREERLKKHLPYVFVDLGPVEWFNKATHNWKDTHYYLVMNLEDRTPWLLFNRYSFGEEDEVDMDEVEPKFPYRAAGTLPFLCMQFAFARIEKQDEIEECDEQSGLFLPEAAANTLAQLTVNENAKQAMSAQPKFSSNKKGKARDSAKRRFKKQAREERKAEEQAEMKAKADAQREDSDSLMENLITNSNKHRKLKITSLDAPSDWILVPRTKIRMVQSGERGRINMAISTEAKLVFILVLLTRRAPRCLNLIRHDVLGQSLLATVYHGDELRAAERKFLNCRF